ncbi:uncharacterized protein LOC120111221 isoform X2 [Phoenix dactylifera]|uniref:Uncharacterized protein LOC120111221 isoform X2 n=1 Tax=Phoenix dactylifera TaxID=42345 RepID=A0A8B9AAJ6_PHODC|nr:uncharacterized protein LOC120111221 isoform X2 [Phoenix dactylifera]
MTHTHRDGSFVREESRDIVDRATNLISERVGGSSSSDATHNIEAQVLAELMGPERYGRVREVRHLQATIEELKQNQANLQSQLTNISSMLQRFIPSQIPDTSNACRDDGGAESCP